MTGGACSALVGNVTASLALTQPTQGDGDVEHLERAVAHDCLRSASAQEQEHRGPTQLGKYFETSPLAQSIAVPPLESRQHVTGQTRIDRLSVDCNGATSRPPWRVPHDGSSVGHPRMRQGIAKQPLQG